MNKAKDISDSGWLEYIRQGEESGLEKLYERHRRPFLRWASWHYKCQESDAAEIYQKAFTIFYFNVKNGKLESLSSSLETYLFGIGKRLFYELFRQQAKKPVGLDELPELSQLDYSYSEKESRSHQTEVVAEWLDQIGDMCKRVLMLYYYRKFTMESIAITLGYKNEKVAKKKKYECLKRLKEMVHTAGHTADELLGN